MKIYADGADLETMIRLNDDPDVAGLTTNPSLMRKAGINDYQKFAEDVLSVVTDKPISFEVFADDLSEMERQAVRISSWAPNVYVKIPITNSEGLSTIPLVRVLSNSGIKVNVTAILTEAQADEAALFLHPGTPAIISIFNGRIMDTGREPMAFKSRSRLHEVLWASTREVWNIAQARWLGYDIITVSPDLLLKYRKMRDMDLSELSLETVRQFARDGAGYSLD